MFLNPSLSVLQRVSLSSDNTTYHLVRNLKDSTICLFKKRVPMPQLRTQHTFDDTSSTTRLETTHCPIIPFKNLLFSAKHASIESVLLHQENLDFLMSAELPCFLTNIVCICPREGRCVVMTMNCSSKRWHGLSRFHVCNE